MTLEQTLNELLKQHSKRDIILALEVLTATQSLEEIRTMKHVDKGEWEDGQS